MTSYLSEECCNSWGARCQTLDLAGDMIQAPCYLQCLDTGYLNSNARLRSLGGAHSSQTDREVTPRPGPGWCMLVCSTVASCAASAAQQELGVRYHGTTLSRELDPRCRVWSSPPTFSQ